MTAMRRITAFVPALVLGLSCLGISAAQAQSSLSLPPPGTAAPGTTAPQAATTKPKPARKSTHARTKKAPAAEQDSLGLPGINDTSSRRSTSTASESKPRRFVPEEFDNGDSSSSGSMRPFMSPTGRAGMGMQF
jgi:hypothetical protein